MVFREETILQVRSLVDKLEKEPQKHSEALDAEVLRTSVLSAQENPVQPKVPVTRQTKSCVASGLFHNVYKGRLKKVQFLLKTGLNVNAKNDYGYGVLVAALHIDNDSKRRRMFEFLLENDADPMLKDPKHKRNALSWAAVLGRSEQADMLLDSYMGEFNFHEKDKEGMTAIHLATQGGHTEIVKSLVREMTRYGTTVDVPDNMGLTPYLHAKRLGYGLIADILKVEGGACEGQGDMYSFKRADEWRDIGIKERNEEVRKRRDSQYEQAAIAGSARMLMEFEGPGYEIISIPTPKQRKRTLESNRSLSTSDVDGLERDTNKSVRILSPRSNVSSYTGQKRRISKYDRPFYDSPDRSPQLNTLSLIQMRETKRGIAPKQFRSSELDASKVEEFKHIVGDLATMMDYLAIQHSKSFRRSVPPLKLKHEDQTSDTKRSTLAILFGKKKGGRKSPKSPGSGKKGRQCSKFERKHGKAK